MKTATLYKTTTGAPVQSLASFGTVSLFNPITLLHKKHNPLLKFLLPAKAIAIILILLFSVSVVKAATITSTASGGDWQTGSTWTGHAVPASTDDVVIATTGSGAVTTSASTGTITCNSITINSGAILTMYRPFIVTTISNITGTINFGSANTTSNLMTFTGDVTLNSGAVWNETTTGAVASFSFGGNFTNNSTTFTAQNNATAVHTFTGTTKTISGSTITAIPYLTINGTATNNGTLTVGAILAGSGTLTNGATSTLNIGGTSTISTLTATAVGNTINYTGSGQTLKVTAYYNLTLSGGAETFGAISTVTGNLTLSGTATATTAAPLAIGGNLTIGTGTTFATGTTSTWTIGVTGTTSVTGTMTFANTGTMIFTGAVTINSGGNMTETTTTTLSFSSDVTISGTLTEYGAATASFAGNLTNNGTFTVSTGTHTFSGATKTIGGTNTISIPTATFTGAYTNSGTLAVATLLTVTSVTLTNNGTITASTALSGTGGITQGTTGNLNIGGTSGITSLNATAVGNTVNFTGAAQTINANYYYNLTLGGSSAKTLQTGTTIIGGNLSLSGTATTALVVNLAISGNLSVGNGTTFTLGAYTLGVTGTTTVGTGTLTITSTTGAKTFTGAVTINSGGAITETAAATLSFGSDVTINGTLTENGAAIVGIAGSLTNNGTYTASIGVHTFSGTSKTLGGTISIPSVTVTGSYTNNGTLTVTSALAGGGSLTNGASSTLNINFPGALSIITLTASTSGNNVNYNNTSAQTVFATNYYNLLVNGGSTKTLGGSITISGTLTLASGVLNTGSGYTITFNGTASVAPIARTSGTINCSSTTSFIFSPTTAGGNWAIPSGTFTSAPTLTNFTVAMQSGGSLTLNEQSITCIGTLTLTSGALVTGTGNTITFNGLGSVAPIVCTSGTLTCTASPSFVFSPSSSGNWAIPTGTFTATPTITNLTCTMQSGSSLTLNDQSINITGYLYLLSGTLITKTGTLTFNGLGSTTPIYRSAGTITSSSASLSFNPSSVGNWTIPAGTFTSPPTLTNFTSAMQSGSSLTLNEMDITCSGTFTLTSGLVIMGTGNLIVATMSASSPSATNMIVTSATSGFIKHSFAAGTGSFLYPFGTNVGTAEYNGFSFTFNTNSTTRLLGFKVVGTTEPNMGTATNYITRYWTSSLNDTTGTYTYTVNLPFISSDIYGSYSKMGVLYWNGSAWYGTNGTVSSSQLQLSSADQTLSPLGHDITGRQIATDEPCGAITLTVGAAGIACSSPTSGTNAGATTTFTGCAGISPYADVWFKFIATATYHFITVQGAGFQPVVKGYYNPNCTNISSGSAIGSCAYSSTTGATVVDTLMGLTIGNTYYVSVAHYSGGITAIPTFTICVTTAASNDNCPGTILNLNASPISGTTVNATQTVNDYYSTGFDNDDVWYNFTVSGTSAQIILNCSSGFNGVLDLRDTTCPGHRICSHDFVASGSTETINVTGLTSGATYRLRVFSSTPSTQGTFTIAANTTGYNPSGNDVVANAMTATIGTTTGNAFLNYGFEVGEPSGINWAFNATTNPATLANTAWFVFVPTTSGCYSIGAAIGGNAFELAVYSASSTAALLSGSYTQIASSTGSTLTYLCLTAGTSYFIQVNGHLGAPGTPAITITSTEPAAAPVAIAATNIQSSSFTANWNSVTNATGYYLDVSTDNFNTFLTGYNNLDVLNVTTYNVTGLTAGDYQYRVRAHSPCSPPVVTANSNTITVNSHIKYWISTTAGGSWTTTGNWSTTGIGGASCGCIPVANDDVVVQVSSATSFNISAIPTTSFKSVTIGGAGTGTVTLSGSTTGSFGVFTVNANTIINSFNASGVTISGITGAVASGKLLTLGSSFPLIMGSGVVFTVNGTITTTSSATANSFSTVATSNIVVTNAGIINYNCGSTATTIALMNVQAGGTLNIISSASVTLSAIAMAGKISINSTGSPAIATIGSALVYTAGSTLQYLSCTAIPDNVIAWPTSNGPDNVIINSPNGVTITSSRSIGGTLTLTSGVLTLSGAGCTLTFSGTASAAIVRTSGTITCTSSPSFNFSPSAAANWTIPTGTFTSAPTLTNFTSAMQIGGSLALNEQSITCSGTFTLTSGLVIMGTVNLQVANMNASSPDSTKMIVTSSTSGYLKHSFGTSSNQTFIYPIGTNAGTPVYSGFSFNMVSNDGLRTLGFKVVDGIESNMGNPVTPANYLSRYWVSSLDVTSGNYVYSMNLPFNRYSGDIVGSYTKMGVMYWNGSWFVTNGTVSSSQMQISNASQSTLPLGYDITGRQSANDDVCGAISLTIGSTCSPTTGTILGATNTFAGCAGTSPSQDVWYSFTATGTAHIVTVTGNGTFASVTQAYYNAGGCGSVSSGDTVGTCTYTSAGGGTITNVISGLTAGRTYYVRVYHYGGGYPSNPTFNICMINPPANDEPCGATSLSPAATCSPTTGNAALATQTFSYATCDSSYSSPARDLWYKFQATNTSHTIRVTGNGTYNPVVQAYSSACSSLSAIPGACANNTGAGGTENLQLSGLYIGLIYYVRVYHGASSIPSNTTFTICVLNPPANDEPCNGLTVTAVTLTPGATCVATAGDAALASQTYAYGNCDSNYTNPVADVWYRFQATKISHTIQVTGNGTYDPVVTAYSSNGATCPMTLTPISGACVNNTGAGGTESLQLTSLTVNNWYYVRVYHGSSTVPSNTTFSICVLNPPVNDDPCGAIALSVGVASCSNTAGDIYTATQTYPGCAGTASHDVWYKFVATASTNIIAVKGNGNTSTGFNPIVQAYSGSDCNSLSAITGSCTDSTGRAGTETMFLTGLTPSNTYYVRVYNYYSAYPTPTTFTICVTSPPANDEPCNAVNLVPNSSCNPTNGDVAYATMTFAGCSGTANDDVWYKFTATAISHLVQVTGSASFNAVIQAYSGACTSLSAIPGSCTDNTLAGGIESMLLTGLTLGVTYYVRVYDYNTGYPATTSFTICVVSSPANDEPCSAINLGTITSTCSATTGDVILASQTLPHSSCDSATSAKDLWYKFTASGTTANIIASGNGDFDAIVEAFSFTGSCPSSLILTSIGCRNYWSGGLRETLHLTGLTNGVVYYVRVYHNNYHYSATNTSFTICAVIPPVNDDCPGTALTLGATPTNGTTVNASQTVDAYYSTGFDDDDVWFNFTALGANAQIILNCSSGFNGILELRNTTCPGSRIVAHDFVASGSTETINVSGLTNGANYKIRVFSSTPSTQGTFTIAVNNTGYSPSGNDNVASAMTANIGTTTGNAFLNYGFEVGEPSGINWAFNAISNPATLANTAWFVFIPPATGSYSLSAATGGNAFELAVYSASSTSALLSGSYSEVASSTGSILNNLCLTFGNSYFIQVNGHKGASGTPAITITSTDPSSPPVATATTNINCNSFTTNWDNVPYAAGYYLDVSTDNFNTFVSGYNNLDVLNVTSYNVTSLAFGNYQYRVRAYSRCLPPNVTVNSDTIVMNVLPAPLTPVFIAGATLLCVGQGSTYTATSVNALSIKYSIIAGAATIDSITGVVNSVSGNFRILATASNYCGYAYLDMPVTVVSAIPVSVSITANPSGSHCAGTNIVFTATPVNDGSSPAFQWQVNGSNVGTNSTTYSSATLANGDHVSCILTSSYSLPCVNSNPATSNVIVMEVQTAPATPGPISGTTVVCKSIVANFSIASIPNATNYLWTLPAGWSITAGQNTITINAKAGATASSGNITINASNSCGTSGNRILFVTVASGAPGKPYNISGNPTPCEGTSEVYSVTPVTGASVYTWSLPAGSWSITAGQGSAYITVTVGSLGDDGSIGVTAGNPCGTSGGYATDVSVQPCDKPLNVKVLLEGMHKGKGTMVAAKEFDAIWGFIPKWGPDITDTISVELHDTANYSNIVNAVNGIYLDTSGIANASISTAFNSFYYLTVKHRNHLETTSARPVCFPDSSISYDFTNNINKAFGANMKNVNGYAVVYTGDLTSAGYNYPGSVLPEGTIDISDVYYIFNSYLNGDYGYLISDLNGDGTVDLKDIYLAFTNYLLGIYSIKP